MSIQAQVAAARAGQEPALVCQVPSGWVVLCQMQFLPGYCILLPDPVVGSLNDLALPERAQCLVDMTRVGDALLAVTGAYRINYAILGNSDPALHAHIVPRYLDEPEPQRTGLPWSYTQEEMHNRMFDPERDRSLLEKMRFEIQTHLPKSVSSLPDEG